MVSRTVYLGTPCPARSLPRADRSSKYRYHGYMTQASSQATPTTVIFLLHSLVEPPSRKDSTIHETSQPVGKSATAYQCFQFVHAGCKDTGQDSLTRLSLARVLQKHRVRSTAPVAKGASYQVTFACCFVGCDAACTPQTAVEMLSIRLRNLRGTTSWPCSRLFRNACRR